VTGKNIVKMQHNYRDLEARNSSALLPVQSVHILNISPQRMIE
jgi:hypothetical protein